MKLIKHQRVGASLSDASANLSVLGICQVVQDAVTEMMGKLKLDGLSIRKKYNSIWLFTRNKTKIFKPIPWNDDEFTSTAFISAITRATLCADVCLKNIDGEICAYSRIEMCALDLTTMRIRRIETVGVTDAIAAEPPEIDITFSKFEVTPTEQVDVVRVCSSGIDISQHTNNVEYIRYILNTYSVKDLREKPIREIEVRYINQSYENDLLTVYKQSCDAKKDVFVVKSADKDVVKCEALF